MRLVWSESGEEVQVGDELCSFRGDFWRFCGLEEWPSPGKSGKVRAQSPAGFLSALYVGVFPDIEFREDEKTEDENTIDENGS
jgi:hypothetical protein